MTRTCYYCQSVEHDDTTGVTSVYPNHENKWFCSTNCLCQHKSGGLRVTKKRKTIKRNSKSDARF